MRYPSTILIAALLSSIALTAQTKTQGATALFTTGPVSESCPVNFFVDRMSAPAVRMFATDNKPSRSGLGLEMHLDRSGASKVVKATVTVHGSSNHAHLTPAINADADRTETFELRSDAGDHSLLDSPVWLKKMSAVSWVDLTEIEYADGSTWHASHISKCRAVPSKLLPVNATAQ